MLALALRTLRHCKDDFLVPFGFGSTPVLTCLGLREPDIQAPAASQRLVHGSLRVARADQPVWLDAFITDVRVAGTPRQVPDKRPLASPAMRGTCAASDQHQAPADKMAHSQTRVVAPCLA